MHFTDPKRIKVFLNDPNKKNFLRIGREVLVLSFTKKELPMYYFKHLYKREIKNYRDYLSTGEAAKIQSSEKLHRQEYISILRNKLNFALYCEKNGINTPKLIAHNFGGNFLFNEKMEQISNRKDLIAFFERVFETTTLDSLFMRPLALNGGRGCFKLKREDVAQKIDIEFENLLNGDYTHTEVVGQHPEINAVHAHSINTLRILTFINDGRVHIVSSFLRVGIGESVVDNGSSGGIYIGIHEDRGTLKQKGYRDLKFGGGELVRHPDSGFPFEDFKIPFFQEACELAIHGAKRIPDRFIGWDIAITPKGPTVIEGNDRPDMFMSDVAYGGILQNPLIKEILSQI